MRPWLTVLALLAGCGAPAETPSADGTEPGEPKPEAVAEEPAPPRRGLAGAVEEAVVDAKLIKDVALIPGEAKLLVAMDATAFVKHPLRSTLERKLGPRISEQLEAATACGVGPETWRRVVAGFAGTSKDMAIVVYADGVGKAATLKCLHQRIGTFSISADGKEVSDATGGGIVVDDDKVAFASPRWMSSLRERIAGQGTGAHTGAIADALRRVDRTKAVWAAGVVPMQAQLAAVAAVGSNATDFAVALDARDGLALSASVAVSDSATAKTRAQGQWAAMQAIATARGMPPAVAKSVKIDADDDGLLTVKVRATNADAKAMLGAMLPQRLTL